MLANRQTLAATLFCVVAIFFCGGRDISLAQVTYSEVKKRDLNGYPPPKPAHPMYRDTEEFKKCRQALNANNKEFENAGGYSATLSCQDAAYGFCQHCEKLQLDARKLDISCVETLPSGTKCPYHHAMAMVFYSDGWACLQETLRGESGFGTPFSNVSPDACFKSERLKDPIEKKKIHAYFCKLLGRGEPFTSEEGFKIYEQGENPPPNISDPKTCWKEHGTKNTAECHTCCEVAWGSKAEDLKPECVAGTEMANIPGRKEWVSDCHSACGSVQTTPPSSSMDATSYGQ